MWFELLSLLELGIIIWLIRLKYRHCYTVTVTQKELHMPVGIVTLGGNAIFKAEMLDNGTPLALSGGAFWTWTTNDTAATLTVSADTNQVVVNLPLSDVSQAIIVTASTISPAGITISGSITVPIGPGVDQFTVVVTQLS